jgi:hypothetical protein
LKAGQQVGTRTEGRSKLLESEEAWELLQSGRESGQLNAEEVSLALDELHLDTGQIDEFYGLVEELKIELVDDVEPAEDAVEPERPDISSDSLQLVL